MKPPFCSVVIAALCGLADSSHCSAPPAAAEKPAAVATVLPQKFEASLEGFCGASYRVQMTANGSVSYWCNPRTFTSQPGTTRTLVKVTPEQWALFRQRLEAAQVWKWKHAYNDRPVPDGTVWKAVVVWGERSVTAEGRNDYPDKKQFAAFTAAVKELLGGKEFK